ncbi:MAG: hypothetical protein ACYC4L_04035 [Chloroflexota bacterium]
MGLTLLVGLFTPLAALGGAFLGACLLVPGAASLGRRATAVVLGAAIVFRLSLLPQPVIFCEDLFSYIWDGRVLSAGVNPYLYPPAAEELAPLAIPVLSKVSSPLVNTPYQPLAETFFAALYMLWPADIFALKAGLAAFDRATVGILVLQLRQLGQPAALVLFYAWNPLPVTEFAGHGHADPLGVFLLSLALLLALRARSAAGAAALGLAALVKVLPLVLAPLMLARGCRFGGGAVARLCPFLEAGDRLFAGLGAMAERWACGLAGPVSESELLALVGEAGFVEPRVMARTSPLTGLSVAAGVAAADATGVLLEARKA